MATMAEERFVRRGAALVLALLAILLYAAGAAAAEKRVALVIGNSKYTNTSALTNPVNDARLMAETLEKVGFEVDLRLDLGNDGDFKAAVAAFQDRLDAAGGDAVALFYYAGHGIQIKGSNYLVPVSAKLDKERDVEDRAYPVDQLVNRLHDTQTRLNIVILDACRNNPLTRSMRSASRGLAETKGWPAQTYIAYSTAANQVAEDGTGNNSPYSKALAEALQRPGLSIEQVFKQTRVAVQKATGNKQTPWEYGALTMEFAFVGAPPAEPKPLAATEMATAAGPSPIIRGLDAQTVALQADRDAWEQAQKSATAEGYQLYTKNYCEEGNGKYCTAASIALSQLAPKPRVTEPVTDCDRYAALPSDPKRLAPGVAMTDMDRNRALRFCREAFQRLPREPRILFQLGRVLDVRGEYEEAAYYFRRAAEMGYAAAQVYLGLLHATGQGVGRDPKEAIRQFNLAAEQGYAVAYVRLGLMYSGGVPGVPADAGRAYAAFLKAAEHGDDEGQVQLAKLLESGRGVVPRDIGKAKEWYRKAAAKGNADAVAALKRLGG
jgi:uncharacterized caspase-like protein